MGILARSFRGAGPAAISVYSKASVVLKNIAIKGQRLIYAMFKYMKLVTDEADEAATTLVDGSSEPTVATSVTSPAEVVHSNDDDDYEQTLFEDALLIRHNSNDEDGPTADDKSSMKVRSRNVVGQSDDLCDIGGLQAIEDGNEVENSDDSNEIEDSDDPCDIETSIPLEILTKSKISMISTTSKFPTTLIKLRLRRYFKHSRSRLLVSRIQPSPKGDSGPNRNTLRTSDG